ncbi:MAG: tetratricopeptide repeat protein [Acidobacteriaceae bacterium]
MMRAKQRTLVASLAGVLGMAVFAAAPLLAQSGATVHGHVSNPAGEDFTPGEVQFTTDMTVPYKQATISNKAEIDANGNYTAKDVKPGNYFVYVVRDKVIADQLKLTVTSSQKDVTLDDDMSRPAYLKAMTPEQRKQLEEYKKKNAEVAQANKVIAKLNKTLVKVRGDLKAAAPTQGDVSQDVADMKQAVTVKPDVGLLWLTYGDTLMAQGRHLSAADKSAGKSPTQDAAVGQEYSAAVDAYKKAITLDSAATKPNPAALGADNNQLGNALTAMGKTADATAAFDTAAKADPTKAGMYYNNEAAVLYNKGEMDAALAAANQAIAADPNAALAYFIKGQALVTKVTVDPKTNKMTPPPGCIEAYQKFLELAPNDPKVPQVQAVLTSLGQTISKSYRAH